MKAVTKEARNGLKVTCPEPESPAEFDKLAKVEGACLRSGNDDIWYRGVFPDFWYWLAIRVAQEFNIDRPMVPNKDGKTYKEGDRKGQVILVPEHSDPQFVDWVAAKQNVAAVTFQKFADEVCNLVGPVKSVFGTDAELAAGERLIAFDPARRERAVRVNEPGKDDLLTAQGLIEQTEKNLKISLGKIAALTGSPVTLVAKTEPDAAAKNLRIVALAVKAYKKAVMEQAKSGLKV